MRSVGSTEKGDDSELVRPLLLERVNSVVETELFKVPGPRGQPLLKNTTAIALLWIISMIMSSLITYMYTRHGPRPIHPVGTFESGFVTELRTSGTYMTCGGLDMAAD